MLALRIPIAVLLGCLFTLTVFWLLWHLIDSAFDVSKLSEATRIEFSRLRADTKVESKREEKVERQRPPPTPDAPRIAIAAGGVQSDVAVLNPVLDPNSAMSKMQMTAGSDSDVIPLVPIPPEYPRRAAARGREGWVQVQFTITETGTDSAGRAVSLVTSARAASASGVRRSRSTYSTPATKVCIA